MPRDQRGLGDPDPVARSDTREGPFPWARVRKLSLQIRICRAIERCASVAGGRRHAVGRADLLAAGGHPLAQGLGAAAAGGGGGPARSTGTSGGGRAGLGQVPWTAQRRAV